MFSFSYTVLVYAVVPIHPLVYILLRVAFVLNIRTRSRTFISYYNSHVCVARARVRGGHIQFECVGYPVPSGFPCALEDLPKAIGQPGGAVDQLAEDDAIFRRQLAEDLDPHPHRSRYYIIISLNE